MSTPTQPDVGVTYISKRRPTWTDNIYGTGLTFEQGQTRVVPAENAKNFLRHADVFERAKDSKATAKSIKDDKADEAKEEIDEIKDDTKEQLAKAKAERAAERKEENAVMDLKESVNRMNSKELASYAKTHFRQDLNEKQPVKAMREQVVQYIDRFGVGAV